MKGRVALAISSFFLFTFFLNAQVTYSETAYATLTVGTYTSITLSSRYANNITFPITERNHLATATDNGNESSYSQYYVTFNGNVQGNITYSATNFTGAGTIDKSNFAVNTTKNGYSSPNHEMNATFANNQTYSFLNNNDKLYSNFWVYVPNVPDGEYKSVVTVAVSEA